MSVATAPSSQSSLRLFDTHCHLDLPALAENTQQHWLQAQQVGVEALLIPAVEPPAWNNLLHLHINQPQWHIALGVHPWWAEKFDLSVLVQTL